MVKLSKKLVNSDFKNHRVEDPTKISARQEKNIKKYVKDYFDKAIAKKKEHDRKKAERKTDDPTATGSPTAQTEPEAKETHSDDNDEVMGLSDNEDNLHAGSQSPSTPANQFVNGEGLKRKRITEDDVNGMDGASADVTPSKRVRSMTPPMPPPPPPPPTSAPPADESTDCLNVGVESTYVEAVQSPLRNGKAHTNEGDAGDLQPADYQKTDDKSSESHWHLNGKMVGVSGVIDDVVSEDMDNSLEDHQSHRHLVEAQHGA